MPDAAPNHRRDGRDARHHVGLATGGPAVILLARPARRRSPTAVVWQLLTYDRQTRTALSDIARHWQPAGTGPDFDGGRNGTVPEPVTRWVSSVLGPDATVTGPAPDYAGPTSWHVRSGAAGADDDAGTGVRG